MARHRGLHENPGERGAPECTSGRRRQTRTRGLKRRRESCGTLHRQGRGLRGAPPTPNPGPAPPPPRTWLGSASLPSPGPSVASSPRGAMASRLLHRLRHALTGDGPGEAAAGPEAEQFPESSELEDDDAEGLSSRLSGTLSFTSAEDDEDQDDEDDEEADPDPLPDGDREAGEDAGECGRMEAGTLGLD